MTQQRIAWRRVLPALLLLLGVVLVAYRDTAAAMVSIWSRSDTFAHAFLVLPIVFWLIWRQRRSLAELAPQPSPWMLVPMTAMAFIWLLADLAAANSVSQLAMTALLVAAVPAMLGHRVARVILFPLAFLFFAVPIGEFMLPQLMSWTADFTVLALRASGIPVFREGNEIVIPSGHWSVVEACSGVRYLIASFMVGSLFGYLHYRSARRRWIFVAIAIAVPIVANWVRAYLIVMLGHLSNNTFAVGVDHLVYGWLFFGLVMGLMFTIGKWWTEPLLSGATPVAVVNSEHHRLPPRASFWATAVVASMVGVAPFVTLQAMGSIGPRAAPRLASLGPLSGGWHPAIDRVSAWKPAFHNPSSESSSTYSSAGRDVGMYIGYYHQQTHQRKLVSSDNQLVRLDDPVWTKVGGDLSKRVEMDAGTLTVRSAVLRRRALPDTPEQRLRVWQLYWVGDKLTASDYWAKVYAAVGRIRGRGDDSAVVVVYTSENQVDANAVLQSFLRANLGVIIAQLRATRDGSGVGTVAAGYRILSE
jgi:exosortase A